MSPRSIRRAAERKAKKLALKARKSELPHSAQASHEAPYGPFGAPSEATGQQIFPRSRSDESPASRPISERQLAANRANAQLSTGPTSSSGRANSCLNAVKTGLTGRTVLLSSDDAAAYQQHVSDFFKEFQPVGPRECALVQSLADNAWRLLRVPALEMAIFAYGRIKFADTFADQDPTLQASLIDMHTFLHYEKQLRNLQIQEARLQRQREKHMTELRQLRQERVRKEKRTSKPLDQTLLCTRSKSWSTPRTQGVCRPLCAV